MQAKGILRRLAARFCAGRSGNFGIIGAILAPVLLLGVGYGVNIAQISLTRSNLLAALDSAVTSTARDLTTGVITEEDAPEVVTAFLMANGLKAFAQEGRLTLDSLVIDRVAGTVTAQASVDLDVAFALFGAANRQKITTESAAHYSDKQIEIAMMLDVTGSMGGQRIADLRDAAEAGVDTMLQSNRPGRERVRIALVPYADSVNVGVLSHTVHIETDVAANRKPHVEPPSLPVAQLVSRTTGNTCATEREGTEQFTDAGPGKRMVNQDYRLAFCPPVPLTPLTYDAARLRSSIRSLNSYRNGFTGGPVGIQWAWYLLSSTWASVLAPEHQPRVFDAREVSKYAILMTDGEFNVAFAGVEGKNYKNQESRARTHAQRLCDEMKKKNIEIFTIGFRLNNTAKKLMRYCATTETGGTKYYHEASTGEELKDAFLAIARNIEKLALTR